MKRTIAKLGLLTVLLSATTTLSLPSKGADLGTSFRCYCNGTYVGDTTSILDCWNAC